MDYLKEICALAGNGPRFEQPVQADWRRVELELGVTLAGEFKELVTAFGSGWFGLEFIFRNPVALGRQKLSREELNSYREMVEFMEDRVGIVLFPRKNGLIVIGEMERQSLMLGPTNTSMEYPNLFLLDHDYEELHPIKAGVAEFMYKVYKGQLTERWASDFRQTVWCNDEVPFFTASPSTEGD